MSASAQAPELLLRHHLKRLKLPTVLREHEKLARQCASVGVDHVRTLARLIELELLDREARMVDRRIKAAFAIGLERMATQWLTPGREEPRELRPRIGVRGRPSTPSPASTRGSSSTWRGATSSRAARTSSPSGRAARARPTPRSASGSPPGPRGIKTRFATAAAIVHEMIEAHDEKRLLRLQKTLAGHELLIIDELGFVPLSKTGAELLFELIGRSSRARRHDRHLEPALRRVDHHLRRRAPHRRAARPAHPPRPHPRDERTLLPSRPEPVAAAILIPTNGDME